MSTRKKIKLDPSQKPQESKKKFVAIYQKMLSHNKSCQEHNLGPILQIYRQKKHPILPVLQPQSEVYKSNPDKKKKPIEIYLDTINQIYKKKDLDILINPVNVYSVFEKWAPLEIAIFQQSILKFGKQFEFISELIGTKSPKDVYEFYLEWKTSTHYKSYKAAQVASNRSNYEDWI